MSPRKSGEARQGDPPKTPKVWEKARREKMKIYFNELEEVLPLYDPSAPMSRFEILQKSRSYIKELQNQNQDLLNGGFDEVYKSKMDKLKHRVKELLQRVDQLTDLLRRANIMIPPLVPCPEKQESLTLSQKWMNQRPKKWTEKINVVVPDEKIENILSLIKDFKKKSNKVGSSKKTCKNFEKQSDGKTQNGCVVKKATFSERIELKRKKQLKKITPKVSKLLEIGCEKSDKTSTDSFSDSQSPSHAKENQPVDFNLLANEESPAESSKSAVKAVPSQDKSGSSEKDKVEDKPCSRVVVNNDKIGLVTGKVKNVIDSQNNVFLPASTNVVQSNTFLLTNDGNLVQFPILNSSGNVFSTNPNLLTQTAIVNQPNSGLLTPLVINRPSPVIVLQKPTPHIQIVNPTPQILSVPNQNIQILRNSILCPTTSQSSKTLPYILSKQAPNKKRITKDSTVTTFVNKIPIPALSKQSYVKKNLNCIGGKGKNASPKTKEKEKLCESEKSNANEAEEVQSVEMRTQTEKASETPSSNGESEKSKENDVRGEHLIQKRTVMDEDNTNAKRQKVSNENSDDHVFKPIENPILSDPPESNENIFCNLKLSGSMGHNLSVSPTAAFLSTFPIVASSKLEDELSGKMDDRRNCEEKDDKTNDDKSKDKESSSVNVSELVQVHKGCDGKESAQVEKEKERSESDEGLINKTNCAMNIVESNLNTSIESNTSIAKENSTSIISNSTSNNNNSNNNNNNNNNNIASNNNTSTNNNNNNNNNNSSASTTTNNSTGNNNNTNNNIIINNSVNQCTQLISAEKTWEDFQQPKNCEVRPDPFYIHSEVQNANGGIAEMPAPISSFPDHGANVYKNSYPQNNMKTNFNGLTDQMNVKNNQFDYGQKDNFLTKQMAYNERSAVKKSCLTVNDGYAMGKNQSSMYQTEQSPNYQLVPVKEMSNQRNARPPVNWMTDPDVRTRSMSYGGTSKVSSFAQPDASFYGNAQASKQGDDYVLADVNKLNYQKNEFYGNKNDVAMKGQCKNVEKRGEPKYPAKPTSQNTYNIFDYNYNGNYFGEEDANKFCNVQNFNVKNKKNSLAKKKSENAVHIINGDQQNDPGKRNADQIIANLDFNSVGNQECFSWVPGKNVEWLPSKSFVDTNLMLPSTLPTLVGDLALGTTNSDVTQTKGPRPNQKTSIEPMGKSYIDLNLGSNASFGKDPEGNKQYLEPFINLSKNIFDLTPSNNMHNPQKNDCDKNGYSSNANETIVLKNIFELPVSKSFANDFANKQRPVNNSQNTFLSVSQLVETPNYESNSIKSEASLEGSVAKQAEPYSQTYGNYHGSQKSYKNKSRNSHYKYNDRKYHGYKNGSSNYTAEALIRSNANLTYQSNEFQTEVNSNFYNKTNQKSDNFPAANEPVIPCSTQNIYSDFNFSSPVPNFNIATSVAADYAAHDGNFSSQNNSFFGDFIPPEYPITESVSNPLLLPPCSIALQNPFIIEKRNGTPEKGAKAQKHYSNARSRKNFDCSKTNYSDFPTSAGIFTNSTIFTTSSCQNLLPVPNQNMPDPNIPFSTPSFSTGNITFPPPLTSNTNTNYQRVTGAHNPTTTTFFPASCHSMFTTCSTTTVTSSRTCLSTIPHTSSSAVITTPFSVGNTPFPSSTQSSLPFLSLSNPIVPPSVPSTSGNTLANFNLSTIFPEINQKGNYHYP